MNMRYLISSIAGVMAWSWVAVGAFADVQCPAQEVFNQAVAQYHRDKTVPSQGLDVALAQVNTCVGSYKAQAKLSISRAYYQRALWLREKNQLQAAAQLIETAWKTQNIWQIAAESAEQAHDAKKYKESYKAFSSALNLLNQQETQPQPEIVEHLTRLQNESRGLMDDYEPVPRDSKAFSIGRVPLPITFETNSIQLTAKGKTAQADLLAIVKEKGYQHITLEGHADERGTAQHNKQLSQSRVEAIQKALKDGGYQGKIKVVGKGEREPMTLDDPKRYTEEEIWQLNRRVELVTK